MNRIALVTGGTRGIGRAIAAALLNINYEVVVTYRQDREAAETFRQEAGGNSALNIVRSDVCADLDIDTLVTFVERKFGRLDVLINNAGRVIRPADWLHVTRESFIETLQTNLVGPWVLTQKALPLLKKTTDPTVIFVGSTYGKIGDPYVIAYSTAKAGLVQLTQAAAKAFAPQIRVNAILPGNINTDMTRAAGQEFINQVIKETPLKRLGSDTEIAQLVTFLVSDACPFITGQTIIVDGGHILR